jgi:hypothetical protein
LGQDGFGLVLVNFHRSVSNGQLLREAVLVSQESQAHTITPAFPGNAMCRPEVHPHVSR